ncbi:ChbG/HpnK family deacetylase [Exiguobacterium acetylicum]|uniref:ChbG/HpnK family deacetylase n=1 Tax=Exiguobacterium acetylicum TaxID=41170 RepID=UPI0027DF7330|nr:ChbG/HpnK family deacetylase [Exiguobacterium acetylicum]MDQ6466560.1 ChbG/HpnK family deacetylase [Exiguobacterium acetylicum]
MRKTRVIVNADDFGLTMGINQGIIESFLNGPVHSTTMMMNGHAVEDAVRLCQQHPDLHVGVHLVLSWGKPLASTSQSLTKTDGTFRFTSRYVDEQPPAPNDVYLEWKAQIEAFLATGLPLHHLDSHHHIHGWSAIDSVIVELANEYQTMFRASGNAKHLNLWLTNRFDDRFYGDGVSFATLDSITPGPSIEVMVHPANMDTLLPSVTSYVKQRLVEKDLLTRYTTPDWWT